MFRYRIFSLILAVVLLLLAVGCTNKTDDAYIYFELPSLPSSLDPQTAESDSELLIIRNIFEGLMRKNSKGEVICGAAESYEKNGLIYTFRLRSDILWSNGDKVTASDYVFGLRRAVSADTKAPFASRLFCIKNAKEINSGKVSVKELGVTAINDSTIKITLSYEDSSFLENLTSSVAMPCNEKFFNESAGKYGLFSDKIICNGSYRLTKWNKESFGIRLYKNEEYNGDFKAKNAAVFLTCNLKESVTEKLIDNDIDIAFIDCALKPEMEAQGFKTENIQNICWVLTMNDDLTENMRTALLKLVGSEVFENSLKVGYVSSASIFPDISNTNTSGIGVTAYDPNSAKALYKTEIKKLENSKFPSNIILYYYDNGFIKPIVTDIVGHWQNNLSAFVNIEAVENSDNLLSQLQNQTLTMSIFPIKVNSKNSAEYLKNYGINSISKSLADTQKDILSSKNISPLLFQDTSICYSKNILEISITEDNGFIDFSFIIKNED